MKSNTGSEQDVAFGEYNYMNLSIVTVGTTWKRYSTSREANISNARAIDIGGNGSADLEIDILIWHPSNEYAHGRADKQTPSEYGDTTSGPIVFAHANGNSVASNIVTEAQGADFAEAPYVVYQPAATNSQIQSNDLTDAEWTATTMTVAQDEDGIDGTPNTACTLTATGANSTVIANAIVAASDDQTTAWWIKRKTGTGAVEVTVDNGGTWTEVTLTSAFQKFTVSKAAVTNPQIGIRIVTNTDAVIVGNAECHTAKIEDEVRGLGPIFTAGASASTGVISYGFDSGNTASDKFMFYFEVPEIPVVSGDAQYYPLLQSHNTQAGGIEVRQDYNYVLGRFTNTAGQNAIYNNIAGAAGAVKHAWIAGEGKAQHNGDGTYSAEVSIAAPFPTDTLWLCRKQQSANNGIPQRIRNLRRYGIPSYSIGKAKIDELMA
jgi:hypothetical protein